MKNISCDISASDPFFKDFLEELSVHFPISFSEKGIVFRREGKAGFSLERVSEGGWIARCADLSSAGRVLGAFLAGVEDECPNEKPVFETNGIMYDCSRNSVPTIPYLKEWLRRMALTGYNLLMLYTEDVYKLPDEPFFGYLRGGYTREEIREIDDYASLMGIELVPCIQTLGHMSQMLRWACYADIKDTPEILRAEEEKTFAFIRKMVSFWAENVRSRRIHIGMDEAHDLGRGAYLDRHGYHPRAEILAEHISRVNDICADYGMHPMIWSDLLVPRSGDLPAETAALIQKKVPRSVDLVHWDYYNTREDVYAKQLAAHQSTGHHTIMATAVWSCGALWYGREYTETRLVPCLNATAKSGVNEWLVTMWNDDGANCDVDSCWNGLVLSSERVWGGKNEGRRYEALFQGVSYDRNRKIARMNDLVGRSLDEFMTLGFLWDDPLLAPVWHQCRAGDADYWVRRRGTLEEALEAIPGMDPAKGKAGDLSRIKAILLFLREKIDLRVELERAYRGETTSEALHALAVRYKKQARLLQRVAAFWRTYWMSRSKPYGWEVLQIRLAGQAARQEEMALRIEEWARGDAQGIPELDEEDIRCTPWLDWQWKRCCSGSMIV